MDNQELIKVYAVGGKLKRDVNGMYVRKGDTASAGYWLLRQEKERKQGLGGEEGEAHDMQEVVAWIKAKEFKMGWLGYLGELN